MCLPIGLGAADSSEADALMVARQAVPRGEMLFARGDPFVAVVAVNTGFFKTRQVDAHDNEQVTGFHMAGELIGLDGLGADCHTVDAIALEDSQVCVVPYAQWLQLLRRSTGLQSGFHRLLGAEIARGLATSVAHHLRAEVRVARFLLDLAARLQSRGYSGTDFVLRMSRAEMGSFLGLTLETVSRSLSAFQAQQWLEVRQRHLCIRDPEALTRLVAAESTC